MEVDADGVKAEKIGSRLKKISMNEYSDSDGGSSVSRKEHRRKRKASDAFTKAEPSSEEGLDEGSNSRKMSKNNESPEPPFPEVRQQ